MPRHDDRDDFETLPPGFWDWPRQHRIQFYASVMRRRHLVAHIRSFIGSGTDAGPTAGAGDRLTVEELAYIAADIGALPYHQPDE